jgi:hypothetical protein
MAHVLKDSMNHYAIEVSRGPKHVSCIMRVNGEVEFKKLPLTKMINDHEHHTDSGEYQFDRRWEPCLEEQDAGCTLTRVIDSFLSGMLPVTDKARRLLERLRLDPTATSAPQPTEEDDMATKTKKVKKAKVKKAKKAKKAPKAKKEPKAARVAGAKKHRYLPEMKISVLVEKNPKRENTKAHEMFALYAKSKTVGDFIKHGGSRGDLSWDANRKFIKITAA